MKYINKYLLYLVFVFVSTTVGYGQSTVNAGGDATICGTTYNLKGTTDGETTGLTWSVLNKPSGATDPVISNPSILTPGITGMNKPGVYTFRLTKVTQTGSSYSDVKITSSGDVSSFSAGTDIVDVFASVGSVNLNGVIPEGFTGEWRFENIYNKERYGRINSENGQLSSTNIANPVFSLIKKADHDVDPAYRFFFKITSKFNPNCSYEKSVVVRFIPNPFIKVKSKSGCGDSLVDEYVYLDFEAGSPIFGTKHPNVSGNPSFGTTVSMNIISQPIGGNLTFTGFDTKNIEFKTSAIGTYKFTLTVSNAAGTFTTPELTYTKTGIKPGNLNFVDSAHPEQNSGYSYGGSAGELLCGFEGTNTPVEVYFKINEKDDPVTTTTTATFYGGSYPGEQVPSLVISGEGQRQRMLKVTPPVGGWRVGTYAISFTIRNGDCALPGTYFIHVSDGNRKDIKIEDVTVCYPGSGTVNATIQLPEVFQEVINPNYLAGNYSGVYHFTVVSKPMNSSTPEYEITDNRNLKSTSTIIRNLDKPGEYVFKVKAQGYINSVDWVLEQEYACSQASRETTFKVIVSEQIGANAGSNQEDVFCRSRTVLVANDPGLGQGKWTVESAPVGMIPTFSDATSPRTIVAGMDLTGVYEFKWTITTGDCESSSIVKVITEQDSCKTPLIITNPTTTNKTIRRKK
ncbi:hypothetical protein [Myroides odoratimimus]|uniref:hypothetical protein n=1 Tax=Myroides odoratimimus TaxID=76832 RepID=UPI0031010607